MKKRTKKALLITAGAFVATLVVGAGALVVLNGPLTKEQLHETVEAHLQSVVDNNEGVSSALFTVASGQSGEVHEFAVGTTGPQSTEEASVDSQYHAASVGKTMLAVAFGQLVDEGVVDWSDPISTWLDAEMLDGLFVVDGVDYAEEVTIGQLLTHTSGAADYFEGPVTSGTTTTIESLADDPDHLFTPRELVDFSREHQQPVGVPVESFSYSDTGYLLAGFVIEAIEAKTYDRVLEDRIFAPLGMDDSYLMTEFGVANDILSLDANGVDISERNALSVDWAGGGVVTTMADLLTFMRALTNGDLVSAEVYAAMSDFSNEIDPGIRYGLGMMQFNFGELSPLLFSMSNVHGAIGATGTFAFYDPSEDTYYIANFGSLDFREDAIGQLVEIRLLFDRLQG